MQTEEEVYLKNLIERLEFVKRYYTTEEPVMDEEDIATLDEAIEEISRAYFNCV